MKSRLFLILLFIFLISFFPRILLLNDGLFHHDSVQSARTIEQSIMDSKIYSSSKSRFGYVFINVIGVYILRIFPFDISFEHQLNLITAFFSCLTVIAVFLIVNELFDLEIALWSALVFSFNGVFFSVSTYLKSHSMALFFALLSFYMFIKYLKSGNRGYLVFILVYMFSLVVRTDNIVYLPLFFVITLFSNQLGFNKVKKLMLFVVFSITLIVSLLFLDFVTPSEYNLGLIFLLKIYLLSYRVVWGISNIILLIALVLFLFNLFFDFDMVYDKRNILLYTWILLTLLPFQILTVLSSRFLLHFIIPLIIFVCYNLKLRFKIYLKHISIFIIIFSVINIYPVLAFRHNFCSSKEFGLFINERYDDSCFLIGGDYGSFIEYYSNNSIISLEDFNGSSCSSNGNYFIYFYFGNTPDLFKEDNEFLRQYYDLELNSTFYMEGYHHTETRLKIIKVQIFKVNLRQE